MQPALGTRAEGDREHLLRAPHEPELLGAFNTHLTEPRIGRITVMLERARRRGELGADIDIAMVAGLVPSLMLQRVLATDQPAGRVFAEQLVGNVLLPVLGRPHDSSRPHTRHGRRLKSALSRANQAGSAAPFDRDVP